MKDFFSKCDQIRSFLQIWSNLLKKSLTENFIFCAVISVSERNNDKRTTHRTTFFLFEEILIEFDSITCF